MPVRDYQQEMHPAGPRSCWSRRWIELGESGEEGGLQPLLLRRRRGFARVCERWYVSCFQCGQMI
jgi:hypothetical protein